MQISTMQAKARSMISEGALAHIEAAYVVRVDHALAAVLCEGFSGAQCVVLHGVLPVLGILPEVDLGVLQSQAEVSFHFRSRPSTMFRRSPPLP